MRVAVFGAGSWGTAIAKSMADVGHDVTLWSRRQDQADAFNRTHENAQYLKGVALPENLRACTSYEETLDGVELVFSVVPSQHTREVWSAARSSLPKGVPILCASKGIEVKTLALMSQVFEEVTPDHPFGAMAGPSFAKEVAAHQPTAVVVGAKDAAVAKMAQAAMSGDWLRAYVSTDVVGLELGGALKNVIAIACGCADGLGLGLNARAALITRGLAEITRCAVKMGADPLTLAGLGGLGDLVLTCTGDLSRNRRVGIGLGKGKHLDEIIRELGQVAEGVETTQSAHQLAQREGVEMPITTQIHRILYEGKPAREVVLELMRRSLKAE
jgi:glycerol-3-phosphate dehydrogenase (NAD(P)+)